MNLQPAPSLAYGSCPHCAKPPAQCPSADACALCRCDYCERKRREALVHAALGSDGTPQPSRLDAQGGC